MCFSLACDVKDVKDVSMSKYAVGNVFGCLFSNIF